MDARPQWHVQETKLIPPLQPGGLIERQRLLSVAAAAVELRLLLVSSTAGSGKSSLLASLYWQLLRQSRAVGWLSLDAADNDHARFLSHLVPAFRSYDARFGLSIAAFLGSGAPLPAATLRTSLLNELAALDRDIYLFLDDYHLITDAEVRETIDTLLLAPLARLHVLIASRRCGSLPVSRLRSQGQIREIESAELAFSEEETRIFLNLACRRQLPAAQVAALHARTEGWAAGLRLASIALGQAGDVERFLAGFSGETRNIGEFLGDEVMRQQRPELQQLMMDLSILQRFNGPLAVHVAEREDARQLIAEIIGQNLFILALDDRNSWFRFHHLFADFLRRRLSDRCPERVVALHRRAVEALVREGLSVEAIPHAFEAGDFLEAGRLLDQTCGQLFAAGQVVTLQQHAARLGHAQLQRLPRLQLELSWDDEIQWRFATARDTLSQVAKLLKTPEAIEPLALEDRSLLESRLLHRRMMLELFTDRHETALELCRQWKREKPANDAFMRASVGAAIMLIEREVYECEAVQARAEALRTQFEAGGAVYGTVFHDCVVASTLFMRGEIDTAHGVLERARRCAATLAGPASNLTAMPTALLAELYYERGELSLARKLLGEHTSVSVEFGFVDQSIARFVTVARLCFIDGRHDDAQQALEAGLFLARRHEMPRLLAHLVAEEVRQHTLRGQAKEALAALERPELVPHVADLMPGEHPCTTREMFALAWARVAIQRGEPQRAVPLLRRWLNYVVPRRCHRAAVRIGALLAHAHATAGDSNAALRVLHESLMLVAHAGFVRSFVDEGGVLGDLVDRLCGSQLNGGTPLSPLLEKIQRQFGGGCNRQPSCRQWAITASGPLDTGVCEALSSRELEIVRLSSEGMATCDIARTVHLSENTVKWYWQRIFAKLGVHRRFDAVRVARQRRWVA